MYSLRIAKRLQGAVPRWFGAGFPNSNATLSVEECLGVSGSTLVDPPCMPYMLKSRTRTLTSAAHREDRVEERTTEVVDEINNRHDELETAEAFATTENILNLPDNLDIIGGLNPELREAMEAHANFSRSGEDITPRQQLESILSDFNNGKATKVTKTALNRLRIDQLRSQLDLMGGDTRGNKAVLVKRILDLLSSSEVLETTSSIASDLPEGVVSGKQLVRATQLRARAGLTHADVGISKQEFQSLQRAAVSKASDYNRAFASPHDVARMLVEARADDIAIIDVRGNCSFTDYMVLATGRSSQLVHMLAQAVLHELKQRCKEVAPGVAPGIEGAEEVDAQWLVVDAGSVVVHIFAEGARKEYNLEGLWGGKNNVTRVATPQRNVQTLHTIEAS